MIRYLGLILIPSLACAFAPLIPKYVRSVTGTFSRFETGHFFDKHGHVLKSHNEFARNQYELLIECGLSSRNNLSLWGAFDCIEDHLNGNSYELADFELSWKQALREWDNAILSTELMLIIPALKSYEPEIRYGRYGMEAALLYAQTCFPKGYKTTFDTRLAYRWYSGFPSDQIRGELSCWVDLSCRWQLLAQTGIDFGLFNGKEPLNRSFFFYNANWRVFRARIEAIYYINNSLALSAGYLQHLLGQNTAVGGEWYGRLSFCF